VGKVRLKDGYSLGAGASFLGAREGGNVEGGGEEGGFEAGLGLGWGFGTGFGTGLGGDFGGDGADFSGFDFGFCFLLIGEGD
jgi:hypothetical protein